MLHRALVPRRLGLLCLVAALGCKPDPVTTTDPESATDAPDPGGPTQPTEVTTDPDTDTDTDTDPNVDEGEGPAATDDTDEGPDEDEDEGEAVAVADPQPKPKPKQNPPKQEREPLPKPAHKLSGPKCQQSFAVGSKVKGFRLPSVEGDKTISPTGYRKRVLLLNFWGTWCKPCLKELPEFDRLYRKYRKHGLTLVAVATDEEPEAVQAFIDKHKLRAKVALDGEEAAGAYSRPNFPFTFVVDSSGKIVAAYEYIDNTCMGDLEQVIRDELEKLDR